ncbi:MAG: (2Fe-2S)-binding protein [Acidobacteria bacterium]|nr:(2Fe-2S)-binding protein [Acidobacteriota bacterium]MBV9474738.1 (2Fe-2S)-binding protein [Acidobacteriota bacterium]
MAKVTIDGIEVEVQDGMNVIEAAKAADVHVPHFCYHPSLSIVGQCRMCLVEVEGMPKLQAGCATPIRDGMKIHVWNEKVDKARKGQMEFLLINHPLDCPICDKAGECPLQDYSFNYGSVTSRYGEFKRTYPGMDRTAIGPHVIQNMNRCIHCTRCIRFTAEITGTSELAFFKRGAATEVGVFPGTPLDNWMSACVTDICPTGALTPREFRFESRVWNLDSTESICNGCDVGCNLFIGHRTGQIFRYRPRVNPEVNDHWLCDYGRFSYERYETDRVVVPKVRNEDDYLGIATWEEALDSIAQHVRGAANVAVIASAQMTNEEAWLAKTLFAGKLNAKLGVMVDPIGPIKMKSRTDWIVGDQAGPNFRGVKAVIGDASIDELLTNGANGVDVLYICDAQFSDRASDPAVIANLRQAKFLIVHSWDANHPLTEVADVVIPGAIHAEKDGTYTNLQGRVQRIHQAFPPKGQAVTDLEAFRRIGARLFPNDEAFRSADAYDVFAAIREEMPQLAEVSA